MSYELMLIVSKNADGEAFLSKVEKSLKEADITSVSVDRLGVKTLAYPIAKQTEGAYFVLNFEGPGEAVGKIREMLRLEQEALLRYLIIKAKVPKKVTKGVKRTEVTKEPEEPKVETKVAKVTVKTKVLVAKKASKVVKRSRRKKKQLTTDN